MRRDEGIGRAGGRLLLAAMIVSALAVVAFAIWFRSFTPLGAASLFWLEISFTPGAFAETLRGWVAPAPVAGRAVADAAATARFQWAIVGVDFLFIPAYVGLLASTYLWLEHTTGRRSSKIALAACGLAGMLDGLENFGLLWLTANLSGREVTGAAFAPAVVQLMSTASGFKWAALAVAAVFIARASLGGDRGRVLLLSRYGLLSLLLGTLPLVATGQGRDLVAALADANASVAHRLFFYLTLTLWAFSVWYWSRVVLDAEYGASDDTRYPPLAHHLPRLLGTATLALPAYSILQAANDLSAKLLLGGACVALGALFHLFVTRRRTWSGRARGPAVAGFAPGHVRRAPAGKAAAASLAVSLSLFVALVAAPVAVGHFLGAVSILFIAAANTVFFGSMAVFVSEASGVRVDVIAFACAAAFSFWNDNHDIAALPRTERSMPLEERFAAWRQALEPEAQRHGGAPLTVFVVAAEGGGIRAAYWTAKVLSALSDAQPDEFPGHVFAISGISGGSLGAAVYAALRRDLKPPIVGMQPYARAILGRDFLAPVLAQLVSGDFAQWFIPVPITVFDRSRAMEQGFVRAYAAEVFPGDSGAAARNPFARSFYELAPSASAGVPTLILSATSVEQGARVVTAPFTWRAEQLPDTRDYSDLAGGGAPTLAAAVHNSARFTYVSPAGLVRTPDGGYRRHVVDGGYFDPSGADVLLDLLHALDNLPDAGRVQLVPVFITNGRIDPRTNRGALAFSAGRPSTVAATIPGATPDAPAQPPASPPEPAPVVMYTGELQALRILGELFAPVRTVLAARDAHGRVAIARQQQKPGAITFGFCEMTEDGETWREVLPEDRSADRRPPVEPPLGWHLSGPMVRQLDAYWDACAINRDGRDAVRNLLGESSR